MADLFLDPRLDDYFVERRWSEIVRNDDSRDEVVQDFLAERISLVSGIDKSAIDFAFLETVRFPQTWGMKKFQFRQLVADVQAGRSTGLTAQVLSETFGGDRDRFHRFVDQLAAIDALASDVISRILGSVDTGPFLMIARFSETRMENLHYDLDLDSDTHEAFRFYINLDAYPRIWSTSYRMTSLLEQGGDRLVGGIDADQPVETIAKRATTRAFGGWHHRATERTAPRHQVYFDPGDVWIVDGRSVSHQVTSGHRVLSVYARIPHDRNPTLKPTFAEKVRRGLSRGAALPLGRETAIVNYFQPHDIGTAADLRADWETVFGAIGGGGLRRFGDRGLMTEDGAIVSPG